MMDQTKQANLITTIIPSLQSSWIYKLFLALIGTLLLTLSAKIQVPFYPVPMTMQTFVILVIAMTFGIKLGSLTVFLYLLEGAFGLPVFAGTPIKGIGLTYMLGPTGGYLFGFIVATFTLGYLAENGFDRSFFATFISMLIGTLLIFLCGCVWLSSLIGLEKAIQYGVLPFIWSELFKIGLATAILPTCWRYINYNSSQR
ncbi:MAG: biotin transporter BioY [Pseudomonadota bacterium]|nr:biotin transporter BioY [Pseudomonadota bacterium]